MPPQIAMHRGQTKLRSDALRIWHAGVEAVRPATLIPRHIAVEGTSLRIGEEEFDLLEIGRIAVVGAGKAGAEMAIALEVALGDEVLAAKQVTGWINVPADCVRPTKRIHLHAGRPAGRNEPTPAGVLGTERILHIVKSLGPRDLCLCLLSGGGSALLPAPVEGLSLASKAVLTREIAARGGDIHQLNTVRRELSRVKGGGLARACQAGHLISLILSDVPGDDVATIASGPTVAHDPSPDQAIEVLRKLDLANYPAGAEAIAILKYADASRTKFQSRVVNKIIGNNATAVDAAGIEAERLGYSHAMISARRTEGTAEKVAELLVEMASAMREKPGPDCLISGGEPTVELCPAEMRGHGGRNQQLALSALTQLNDWRGVALVSGGTDGEDGPTDAAGAFVDEEIAGCASALNLDAADYLRRNDAYVFFESVGGLLKTGPTHTNVCDVRVVCVDRYDQQLSAR